MGRTGAAFCAPARLPSVGAAAAPAVCARRAPVFLCAQDSGAGDDEETLDVYRRGSRRRAYNGDLLPFDVTVVTPPPRTLGRFRLDARTHCGDVIEHAGAHFLVKSVTLHYRYGPDGRPNVVRKSIAVKTLARRALEMFLERALHDE